MRSLIIHRESIESQDASALIAALNAELSHLYTEPGVNFFRLLPDELAQGRGAFLIARSERQPVGCGAIRKLDDTTAELKRMYVLPKSRGQGVGRELLQHLEAVGRELGVARLVLETGIRQPEAISMYRKYGYTEIPLFGEYKAVNSNLSVCMEKSLPAKGR